MENKKDDGGPAFPRPASTDHSHGDHVDGNDEIKKQDGMSLRDWYAGMALQGIISNNDFLVAAVSLANEHNISPSTKISCDAYLFADAMLKERQT